MHLRLQLPLAQLTEMDWDDTMSHTSGYRDKLGACQQYLTTSTHGDARTLLISPLTSERHGSDPHPNQTWTFRPSTI
ncbi:hypothetical protein Hypma_016165 [Hypsizygus marmoreus]|uniref:Uncharacterized protein n=1 Tax=Hypsizygus marmoreus TaxID=39966 RepID=A0A369IYZ2_HYPMA|nr:hypothetical protein Hypma_016165 [Hypsizygus marmoreus]